MASRYATSGERAFYAYEKNRLLSKILMATRCHWQLVNGGDAVVLSLKALIEIKVPPNELALHETAESSLPG